MDKQLPILDLLPGPENAVDPALAVEKLHALRRDLARQVAEGALVAFSGGMDSAFLLWAAHAACVEGEGKVVALTTTSPSTPAGDREDARSFCERLGISHVWRESREVSDPAYVRNDRDRCYHCKTELFRIAREVAEEKGLQSILYGYNASDLDDIRPGHRAAVEAGILSPLADVGLTKAEIRNLMEEVGLPLARKAASPCLSSRIMTGIPVTPERLSDVEAMETILREAGVDILRVRVCRAEDGTGFLRVEVPPEEMSRILECRETLQRESEGRGYRWLTLDLGGYRTGGGTT